MNTLLLLFALPISTIILSIVLQKILKCPILVAATFFAIYLIVAFAFFDSSFLIFVIIYTILAYVTAVLTRLICNILERLRCLTREQNNCSCINSNTIFNSDTSGVSSVSIQGNNGNNSSGNNCNTCNNQAEFTVTTNQNNPVLFLTNRNNIRRNNCCCQRR